MYKTLLAPQLADYINLLVRCLVQGCNPGNVAVCYINNYQDSPKYTHRSSQPNPVPLLTFFYSGDFVLFQVICKMSSNICKLLEISSHPSESLH